MYVDELREYLLSRPRATEDTPFGPDVLVYRVGDRGKMFALLALEREPLAVNLKCDPERAVRLRERYPDDVLPGYHMDKRHWNTVVLDGVPSDELREMVDHSWELIVGGLTPRVRRELGLEGA